MTKRNSITLETLCTSILFLVCAVSNLKSATVLLLAIFSGLLKLKITTHNHSVQRAFFNDAINNIFKWKRCLVV